MNAVSVLRYLRDRGASMHMQAMQHDYSPMQMAASSGALEAMRFFVDEYGADMNARDQVLFAPSCSVCVCVCVRGCGCVCGCTCVCAWV